MTYASIEKTVTVDVKEEDIVEINEHGEISLEVYVDVDLCDFDDDDIRTEYFERFDSDLEESDWRKLYEQRRALPVEDFLKIIDNMIMNNTGRIL